MCNYDTMNMDKETEKAMVCDAKKDILCVLNKATDEALPCPDAVSKLTSAYEKLYKVEHEMDEAGVIAKVATADDGWGDADPQAKAHFMLLMNHYQGFWRCAAEYGKSPTPATKAHMLEHFQKQLEAHDKIAEYVKGRCPGLCPEIMQILQNWRASKGMT